MGSCLLKEIQPRGPSLSTLSILKEEPLRGWMHHQQQHQQQQHQQPQQLHPHQQILLSHHHSLLQQQQDQNMYLKI